jgi:hypothetical protein
MIILLIIWIIGWAVPRKLRTFAWIAFLCWGIVEFEKERKGIDISTVVITAAVLFYILRILYFLNKKFHFFK